MKKSLLLASLLVLGLLYACKKRGAEIEKPEPGSKGFPLATFNYTGKMEVSEFKVYKGGPGGGVESSKDYTPEGLWEGRVKNFTPPSQLVFKTKDTLSLLPNQVESDIIKYKISGDTLMCYNRYGNFWEVYGTKTNKRIEYKMTFYVFNRLTPPYLSAAVGTEHGVTLFKNVFVSGRANFESPAQMTNTDDIMGWYNVSFIYESKDNT